MIRMENLKSFKTRFLLTMLMVFAGGSVWAQITPTLELTDKSNNGSRLMPDDDYLTATYYPNWLGFEKPTVALYTIGEGDLHESQLSKYQITYYVDGHESDTSFGTDVNGNQITTDATTGTTITRYYGDVKIGSSTGEVTIRVVAKAKAAFASQYADVYKTYKIRISPVTPTVSASPSTINLKVSQTTQQQSWDQRWSYTNVGQKVALPTPSITLTQNGRTQDLSEFYNITYAPKVGDGSDEKIQIVTNGTGINDGYSTYLTVKLSGTDASGNNLENEEDAVKPYSSATGIANLTVTFTPKPEYASTYSAQTLDVPVNINFTSTKMTATLSMINPLTNEPMAAGETLHYVKYGHNYYSDNYMHPFPIPVVTGSDGSDLSKHGQLAVKYFVVEDNTYEDRCQAPETIDNGTIQSAGEPTGSSISSRPATTQFRNTPAKFQTGLPGLLKVGMVVVADHYAGDGNGIEAWYEFTKKTPFENTKEGYEERNTEYKCLTEPVYFYIDVMKRSPKLVFDPDPSSISITQNNSISFNNRFEVSGYIDDSNDGEAGILTFDGNNGGDTFQYSFEFPADAGIVITNWPHYDRMVALDENGVKVAPDHYDFDVKKDGSPVYTDDQLARIKSYKYWSVKGFGTDKLWTMTFTKTSEQYKNETGKDLQIKYTIWPWNHVRWDIGEEQIVTYTVTDSHIPELKIDPQELVASLGQQGFAEPEVWVVDNFGTEVSKDFDFTFTVGSDPSNTGTTVANSTDNSFQHEVAIGSAHTGDVTIHVVATNKKDANDDYVGGYTVHELTGDYTIHIMDGSVLYEIISSKEEGAQRNSGNTGTTDYDYAKDKVMGKMHFIGEGTIYAGYTISGIPGLNLRFGTFDGSTWTVQSDGTEEVGSYDNANDIRDGIAGNEGKGNKFITDSTPVVLNEDGIATGGAFYELYAITNGFLTVDARWEAGQTYVLVDYDDPSIKQEFSPTSLVKGDHTFTMPLLEDHSYHLYCKTGGQINMHGVSFEPAFINNISDTAPVTTGSAFLSGLTTVPVLAEQSLPSVVTYSSADASVAEVNATTGKVSPKSLSYDGVIIRGKVQSQTKENVFKYPYYNLIIADIPTYRLGDGKDESIYDLDAENYGGQSGQVVTTYNIPTPIRMTYGGWANRYTQIKLDGTENAIANGDAWENKGEYGVGGFTEDDHQFNKFIDGFSYSNVCKENPSDEDGYMDYRNYLTGADNMSKGREGYYMNTFTLPAHGAYWRFEPRTSGYLFVYLVQNGVCSYTGDPHSLLNTSKNYERLMWQPLYVVDETGAPVSTDISYDSDPNMSAGVKTFLGSQATYTEGILRCGKDDDNVKANTNLTSESNEGTVFQWSKTVNSSLTGFDADYKGSDSNKSALKSDIIDAWTGVGERQSIFKDDESNGYALISKAYVRYAVRVKAGKSYWVFQNNSKPQFSGFAFVPDGFDGTAEHNNGPAATSVTISDDDAVVADQYLSGSFTNYNVPCNVTYRGRVFKNKTWTSLCLPFAVSEYNFKKVFGEKAKIVTYEKLTSNNTNIHFVQHNYHMMEAGRPYFIYPDFDEDEGVVPTTKSDIVFEGVTFEEGKPAASEISNDSHKEKIIASDGFHFVGSTDYNTCYMPMFSYFMSDSGALKRVGKYYPGTTDVRSEGLPIGRYRAYLKNPTSDESLARIGKNVIEEPYEDVPEEQQNVVTVIEGVTDGSIYDSLGNVTIKGIYTIDGKKISNAADDSVNLPAGVYIINGQKVVK